MLNLLFTAFTLAALCALCVFLTRAAKIPSGAAPFTVLCFAMVWLSVFGCIGFLSAGVYLLYALCAAALCYCIVTRKKASGECVFSPAFLLFLLCGAGLLLVLFARKPYMFEWDEYSLWGMAVKMTAETNTLYPAVEAGFPWAVSQKPGLIVLAYLFNFFGSFEPWRMYFAYDILMLSAFAAACALIPRKNWSIAVPMFAVCAILPFINVYTRVIFMTTPYINAYADIPMGIVMGGTIAVYLAVCRNKNKALLLLPAAGLAALTLCKDTGLPLGLLCAALICADILFLQKNSDFVLFKRLRGIWGKLVVFIVYILSVGLSFQAWNKYLASLSLATNGLGGESNMTPVQLVLNGVLMLFGLEPTQAGAAYTEKFALVFDNMWGTLIDSRITILGTGITVFGVILALLALAWAISGNKQTQKQIGLWGAFGILSFFPYYVFIGFTYVFIFKGDSGIELIDYNRYVGCYYAALLLMALALFAKAMCGETRLVTIKNAVIASFVGLLLPCGALIYQTLQAQRKLPYLTDAYVLMGLIVLFAFALLYGMLKPAAKPVSLLLSALVFGLFCAYLPMQLTVIDYPDAAYDDTIQVAAEAEKLNERLNPGDKVFYVSSSDIQGKYWFMHHYYLYPAILDYSWGGGDMHDCAFVGEADEIWHFNVTRGQLAAYLYESENDYIYVRDTDSRFKDSYGDLFDGGLIENGLYKIERYDGAVITDEVPSIYQKPYPANKIDVRETVRTMQSPEKYISFVLVGDANE